MSTPPRILLVDDDATTRESYRRLLQEVSCTIDEARTGAEALEHLEAHAYALVVLDLRIPKPGGLTLLRHVRNHHPRTRVLVVTGYATIENVKECIQLGAFEYVQKPPQPQALQGLFERALAPWPSTPQTRN